MLLPIVTRELRVRARLPSTAYTRMAAAALVMLVATPTFWSVLRIGTPAGTGTVMFQFLSWILLLFVLFEGVRASAGVISDERRDGTLGLLFLTHLSPVDILLGKLAGSGLTVLLALLATVPVLATALLLGGVTGGELVRGAVALLVALALALATGLWASARSRESLRSLLLGLGLMLGWVLVPAVLDLGIQLLGGTAFDPARIGIGLLSPAQTLALSAASAYTAAPERFWLGQAVQLLISVGLVFAAGVQLRRSWRQEEASATPPAPVATPTPPRAVGADPASAAGTAVPAPALTPAPTETPAQTVTSGFARRLRLDRWRWILIALMLVPALAQWASPLVLGGGGTTQGSAMALMMVLQIPAALAGISALLLLAYLAVRALSEARRTGELELLLTTPLGDVEVVAVLWRQFRRLVTALTVLAAFNAVALVAVQWFGTGLPGGGSNPGNEVVWYLVFARLASILHTWLGSAALVWVGLWLGLRLRRPLAAVGWTFGLVGILTPVLVQFVGIPVMVLAGGRSGSIGILYQAANTLGIALLYLAWIRWARRRLAVSFRAAAAGFA
jgi:hypothetical protein